MSTLDTQITRARRINGGIDVNQYSADAALEDANVVIHIIEDYITSAIGEGFFWDILTAGTTVIGQSEYQIPTTPSGNFNGTPKVEAISIQYSSTSDLIPATIKNRDLLLQEHDLSWYEVNQPVSDPIFFIADSSVFIYPSPLEAVAGGIKFYWIKNLADAIASTTYANLFWGKIPEKYYYMISEGMSQFIQRTLGNKAEAEAAKNIFEREVLTTLVEKLGNRKVGITKRQDADVSKYK